MQPQGGPFSGSAASTIAQMPPQQQQQPTQGYHQPAPPPHPGYQPQPQYQHQQQQAAPTTPLPTVPQQAPPTPLVEQQKLHALVPRTPDQETPDGRIQNKEAIARIRDSWIYEQVRARQTEFTNYRSAHCLVGTWNVNAKGKEEPLDDWLQIRLFAGKQDIAPDIVAVGFQEIVDLNAVNVAVDNKTQQRSQFWTERLRVTLANSRVPYTLLVTRSMVGLLICVFVKTVHQPRTKHIQSCTVGVGVLGMGGNKGGVCVRLQFYDSTVCFVCSHLAAHRENVVGRNADYSNILSKATFDVGEMAIREVILSGSLSHWFMGSTTLGVNEHDIVVWLGDLNYRIDESMPTEKVLRLSEKAQLEELKNLDQLNVERKAGRSFQKFQEGPLNFVPTYKYQPGTDIFEQRPDKKLRAPAWCDRILWMSKENPAHVEQLSYGRSERPNVSDHKPVYSILRMTVKDVVPDKREALHAALMRRLDMYENESLPTVGLDRVHLDFGEIRYEESVTLSLQITNTGSVVAYYRLVPKPDEQVVCKPWLKASSTYGTILPGEAPCKLDFTLTIDRETARMLNAGREVLDEVLILRLENGRDYYITVGAKFARSCFGMSADELVMYTQPVRNIPIDPIERTKQVETSSRALCVPKELWRVIDAIYEKGITAPRLFVEPGIPDEVKMIRENLDTGKSFGPCRVHSYAEALVSFLSSLSSPIIPTALFPTAEIDSQNIQLNARRILEELPPIHYNIFVYVASFFREVLQVRDQNQLTAAKVARVCCTAMAPGSGLDDSGSGAERRRGMQLILGHLLETNSI